MLDILIDLLIICAIVIVGFVAISLFIVAIYIIIEIIKVIIQDSRKNKEE